MLVSSSSLPVFAYLVVCLAIPGLPLKTSFMCPNARHYIRPFKPPIYDQASDEQTALQSSTPVSLPDLTAKRFSEAKEAVTEFSKTDQVTLKPGSDVVITPLGTSSACPTKFRNGMHAHPVLSVVPG